jgi:K+-sensing histidine kinase KdpD
MHSRSLQHVSVWLDGGPSDESVFPQAMDWAFRLNLPLRAVVTSSRSDGMDRSHAPVVEKMKASGIACAQRGIVLDMFFAPEGGEAAMDQFLRPQGFCVFVENASSHIQEEVLARSSRIREIAMLMCPPICKPMTRIMVLHHQPNPNAAYLESVARLCRALEIQPIILIVATTEREAHFRQGYAEGVCNSFRLLADFDSIVGCDLRSAVSRVAAWRSCSHLIIARQNADSWWQRAKGDLLHHFRGLSDSLNILALPEAMALDIPPRILGNARNRLRNGSAHTKHESSQETI